MNKILSDKTKIISKSVGKYILELLIVAFGVFLGIYVGERNNQQKTDLNTKKALTHILSELNTNAKRLELAIEYHDQIRIELDSVTKNIEPKEYEISYFNNKKFNHNRLPNWSGMGTVKLSKTNFESAKIGGTFQELNITTINIVSEIYEYQEIYADFSESTVDKFLSMNSNTKTGDVVALLQQLVKYDIALLEKDLLKQTKTSIKELEVIIDNETYKKYAK